MRVTYSDYMLEVLHHRKQGSRRKPSLKAAGHQACAARELGTAQSDKLYSAGEQS